MPKERACRVLNQNLGLRKLSADWVPRLLHLCSNEHFQNSVEAINRNFGAD